MTLALRCWLFAWFFVTSIAVGALANLMIHALTGGRWGEAVRPALERVARLLPVFALAFLPILVGASSIYPWSAEPNAWLNFPFWALRSVGWLVLWSVLGWAFLRASGERRRRFAAGGLVVLGFSGSLAAVDWIASLTLHWHSSGFGLVVVVGQMLAGMAFGVCMATRSRPTAEPEVLNDLGNLLLMYVLTWAYLAYTQLLITWEANLPHEIAWYVPRLQTGWVALGIFLVVFHFAVPLLILLSRRAKRAPAILGAIALALLIANAGDVAWLVFPVARHA